MSRLFGRFLYDRRDTTFQQVWGADTDNPASPWTSQRAVTRDKALGLSAVFACVRLITDTISTLPLKEYSKEGGRRIEVDPQPEWIDRPIPRDPSVTAEVHIGQIVASLLLEGNAFTYAAPDIFHPAELRVLDPRRVEVKRGPDGSKVFKVTDWNGHPMGEFDWTNVLHVPLLTLPGELRGLAPLEAERLTFAGAIAAEELAGNFLQNGTWMSAMVEMPAGSPPMDTEKADKLIGQIEKKWSGSRKAGKVGILTGGATLKQLSVTPEQAQFLQTRMYDDERIFRIFRCPPALVGMTREGAVSYASSVMQSEAFEKHTVRPLVTLIESAYGSLVQPGNYLRFNTAGLLRADLTTRYNAHSIGLQNKFLKIDEVRAIEDMDPLGGDDGGLLQTPNNNSPDSSLIARVNAGLLTHDEARELMKQPPIKWSDDLSIEEITSLIEQVKAGLRTEDEARGLMKLPPIKWPDTLTQDDIKSLIEQVQSGLLTYEEAREVMKRPPIEWPDEDNMTEKIEHLGVLIKAGFDPVDALKVLGLPPIKHLGLPPVTVQKEADAEGVQPAPVSEKEKT